MKNLHTVTDAAAFPQFWDEEWLRKAISELDLRNMNAEQKLSYEMALSANALAIKNEKKKIEAADAEGQAKKTREFIENGLTEGLDLGLIARLAGVSVEFVKSFQER